MIGARPLLVLAALLAGGCAGLDPRPQPAVAPLVSPPASADEALGIARDLAARGRWSDGVELLESAGKRFAGDPRLENEKAVLAAGLEHHRRILEDRILVADAENQRDKISLLEQLLLAEPGDLVVLSRRIYWREILATRLEPLTACGEYHAAGEPELARRCFDVASALPAPEAVEQRLASIDRQLRANENMAAERRRAGEERERQLRAKVLLGNARAAIDARDYRGALDILERVARLQPHNHEAAGLRQQAWSMISPQVEALVKLGDHLYLDEQLEAAVATWQAALTLKPGDEDILARIERATTVLDRLDTLRRQQKGPAAGG